MTARVFECSGAPRDLGFDQGRACRADLQALYRRAPHWRRVLQLFGRGNAGEDRLVRDLTRHFPQQSEALEGMVRGAGVPYRALAAVLARELANDEIQVAGAVAATPALTGAGALVARRFDTPPVVRRSRPEGGLESIEWTRPWLTAALAGVNAGGLAAASVTLSGIRATDPCAAPAALLVQDCLARFDSVDGASDWCSGRPVGGCAAILLADATGAVAVVEIDGSSRRTVPPKDGLALAGRGALDVDASLRAAGPLDAGSMAAALGAVAACLDPTGRRIGLRDAVTGTVDWLVLEKRAS